jgi:8-oxo-dGTP pyrophosphatase MutT (NUDIX family)
MVTSTDTQQWLFPKGTIEEGESAQQAAIREAFEEAGVRGSVSAESLGIYEYEKLDKFYRVEVFLLDVDDELENWPEDKIRRRSWFEAERAATIVQEEYLKQIIVDFKKRSSLDG